MKRTKGEKFGNQSLVKRRRNTYGDPQRKYDKGLDIEVNCKSNEDDAGTGMEKKMEITEEEPQATKLKYEKGTEEDWALLNKKPSKEGKCMTKN